MKRAGIGAALIVAVLPAWAAAGSAMAQAIDPPPASARPSDRPALFERMLRARAEGGRAVGAGDWATAEPLFREAHRLSRKIEGFLTEEAASDALARVFVLHELGRVEAVQTVRDQAVADRSRGPGARFSPALAELWRTEAHDWDRIDRPRARRAWQAALEIDRNLPARRLQAADDATNLADALNVESDSEAALVVADEAVALAEQAGDPETLADALVKRGETRGWLGDPVGGEADLRRAAQVFAPDAWALKAMTRLLADQGRYDEAVVAGLGAVAAWEAMGDDYDASLASSLDKLGQIRTQQGELADGEALYRRAVALAERAADGANAAAFAHANLAWNLHLQGRYAEAEPLMRRAAREIPTLEGLETLNAARTLTNLGGGLQAQGRHDEALVQFRAALAAFERTVGLDNPVVGWTVGAMARSVAVLEGEATAEPLYRQSLVLAARLPTGHPEAAARNGEAAEHRMRMGQPIQALDLLRPAGAAALSRSPSNSDGAFETGRNLFRLTVRAAWTAAAPAS